MASVINTNVASLNAQKNLTQSQSSLATSLQRLSSGLRINSAKDDAAGLAISDRFTTQIRGLNQAGRNANDAISLSQTAEGALSEVTSNLQRIRELAVQSANATNSSSDRAALDLEVQQRLAEIDRISSSTSFNGQKILDGTFGNAAFQVGANVGETISLDLTTSMRQASIGDIASTTSTGAAADFTAVAATTGALGTFTATSGASVIGQNFTLAVDGVDIVNFTATGTSDVVDAAFIDGASGLGNATVQANLAAAGITVSGTASLNTLAFSRADGVNFDTTLVSDLGATTQGAFTNLAEGATLTTTDGDPAGITLASGDLSIAVGTGAAVEITGTFANADELIAAINNVDGAVASLSGSEVKIIASADLTISGNNTLGLATATVAADTTGLSATTVDSVDSANETILRIDAALGAVSDLRSTFGAIQNRFESTISNLSTAVENLSAARSRILDADFAAETANLTRAQILQQAGTAMLAQANSLPQNVLSLLG
ncbi:MAG: flagellin [Pseudomonadota bacterium]|nr:flagellin [Pseudomonadota bacterium]